MVRMVLTLIRVVVDVGRLLIGAGPAGTTTIVAISGDCSSSSVCHETVVTGRRQALCVQIWVMDSGGTKKVQVSSSKFLSFFIFLLVRCNHLSVCTGIFFGVRFLRFAKTLVVFLTIL